MKTSDTDRSINWYNLWLLRARGVDVIKILIQYKNVFLDTQRTYIISQSSSRRMDQKLGRRIGYPRPVGLRSVEGYPRPTRLFSARAIFTSNRIGEETSRGRGSTPRAHGCYAIHCDRSMTSFRADTLFIILLLLDSTKRFSQKRYDN